ncbi:hypothetical protein OSH76_22075, partial [Mycobacterium ulcerans]
GHPPVAEILHPHSQTSTRGREHPYPHAGPAATAVDRTTAGKRCWSGSGDGEFRLLVGGLGADAKSAARASARKKAPRPDGAEVPVVAPAPSEPARSQRRRRTKVGQLGRGFEYMDLESETTPDSMTGSERITTASGLAGSAGTFGFSGVAGKSGDRTAAGLIKLAGDGYDDGPRTPAMPSTWDGDSAPSPD